MTKTPIELIPAIDLRNGQVVRLKRGDYNQQTTYHLDPIDVAKRFLDAGIETRPLIAGNIQRQPFYAKYERRRYRLPGADFLHECAFYCANRDDLSADELRLIAGCLKR